VVCNYELRLKREDYIISVHGIFDNIQQIVEYLIT